MNAPAQLRLRWPLPSTLLTASIHPPLLTEVRVALGDDVTLLGVDRVRDCCPVLERQAGVCVLCVVPGSADTLAGNQLLELRTKFPRVPVVALFVDAQSDSRWALRLGQAGVTELVPCGHTVARAALIASLSRCETESVAMRLWKSADLHVSDSLANVLKPAVRLAHTPISLGRLAAATQMHERTLRKYCDHHHLASPQWIIGWARLLVAAYYLEEPGRTVQSIADLLAFPSAVAFANHVRRYTRQTPTTLRERGAVMAVAELVRSRLDLGSGWQDGRRTTVAGGVLRLHRG